MKRLLKPAGTLYLHCDPTASHYVKILLDAIFGFKNFRNEIVWCYDKWVNISSNFRENHDIIFRYTKGEVFTFNVLREIDSIRQKTLDRGYTTNLLRNGERQLIVYKGSENKPNIAKLMRDSKFVRVIHKEPEGNPLKDYWLINSIHPKAKERMGYPTQKPLALLRRIIMASSNEGDLVLDPFCGCATTVAAAHELKRNWIGIDIAYHAIKRVSSKRLDENYGLKEGVGYVVMGVPNTKEAALDLWLRDKYQFQRWIVEQVDGFVSAKQSGDGGIDGRIYFRFRDEKTLNSMIIEVKGGEHVGVNVVRDLRGAMEREKCAMAGLVIRDELGDSQRRNFQKEMTSAGFIHDYPRMQLLTIDDILSGKGFNTPYPEGKKNIQPNLL